MNIGPSMVEFIGPSGSSDTVVELGYVPDFVEVYNDYAHATLGTIIHWFNGGPDIPAPAAPQSGHDFPDDVREFPNVVAADPTFSAGVYSAGDIVRYKGGETIKTLITVGSAIVYVDSEGNLIDGTEQPHETRAGIRIIAGVLTVSKRHFLVAHRRNQ